MFRDWISRRKSKRLVSTDGQAKIGGISLDRLIQKIARPVVLEFPFHGLHWNWSYLNACLSGNNNLIELYSTTIQFRFFMQINSMFTLFHC